MSKKSQVHAVTVPQEQQLAVDIKTAARLMGASVWCVRTLVWSDKLPHFKLGNKTMFRPEDLRAFVNAQVRS